MTAHPNRSRRAPSAARNPSPAEVQAARHAAGLTQAGAASIVHTSVRSWQQWEAEEGPSSRSMHPAFWELFLIKTGQAKIGDGCNANENIR